MFLAPKLAARVPRVLKVAITSQWLLKLPSHYCFLHCSTDYLIMCWSLDVLLSSLLFLLVFSYEQIWLSFDWKHFKADLRWKIKGQNFSFCVNLKIYMNLMLPYHCYFWYLRDESCGVLFVFCLWGLRGNFSFCIGELVF